MQRTVVVTILLAVLVSAPAGAQRSASAGSPLDRLGWLAGCWRLSAGERVTDEQWMAPAAGLMMGMSRTIIGGEVREFERLLIRAVDGRVEYVADPSGQRETVFTATSSTDSTWVFANEAHDFPQRIVYRSGGGAGADSLLARIEGTAGGRLRAVDFPMARVPCELPPADDLGGTRHPNSRNST